MRLTESSDEALVERIARGDQSAMAELYDRYQALVYGFAVRLTGDAGTAQDVVQETFLGVWRRAGDFVRERAAARTWIMAICHHRAVDALRRRRPTITLPDEGVGAPLQLVEPDVWPEVARRIDRDAVRQAMQGLPDAQREVIELAYFRGLTQNEIARLTEAPLGTVKGRARLALAGLRSALEGGRLDDAAAAATDAGALDR